MIGGIGAQLFYVAIAFALAGCFLLALFARGTSPILGWMLRSLAACVGIAVLAMALYSQRDEIAKSLATLVPAASTHVLVVSAPPSLPKPSQPDFESFRVLADSDGHFRVDAMVDGVPIRFLVDTGASIVVLNQADARHIGFNPDSLAYSESAGTANGTVAAAPIVIPEMIVGPIRLTDVRAAVDRQNGMNSLLGMSFLSRIQGYEVSAGALTLHR